jgi:dolichol-phosphate mannosyltransferase
MISIILPTYNEAGNIELLIKKIINSLQGYKLEIIIVDDNSPDGTWQIVKNLQRKLPQVKLFRRINQTGLTSAFNHGIKHARGSIIGWMDSDLSMPPKHLRQMIGLLSDFDVVIGSRYIKGGQDKRRSRLAVILSYFLHLIATFLLGRNITDYTSGYIIARRKVFKKLKLRGDYGEYFIDMIYKFNQAGYKIKEIPYICIPRVEGESKTATNIFGFIKRGRKYLYIIFKIWLKKLFS